MNRIVSLAKAGLKKNENRAKSVQMSAYMKGHFNYYGVTSPKRKEIVRELWFEEKDYIKKEWRIILKELWKQEEREFQYVAMDLLSKIYRNMEFKDLDLILDCVVEKSWWDTVDLLASTPVGYIVSQNLSEQERLTKEWIHDENMWMNRTALLHQLKYKESVNLDLLFENILVVKHRDEFFINKASGWALRQASKFHPTEIRSFIHQNPDLSNLTKREGSKYL